MTKDRNRLREKGSIIFLVITCIVLLSLTATLTYLEYSTTAEYELNQGTLLSKYNNLDNQYRSLQENFTQFENTTIKSANDNLRSMNESLQAQYNASLTKQNILQTQYDQLQLNYSALMENFARFTANYNNLQPVESFSYLIFSDGKGTYFAENGTTRSIDYSGADATKVGQNCLNALSGSGGKIVFKGNINLNGPLVISNNSGNGLLELSGFGPSTQLIVSQNGIGITITGQRAFGEGGPYHVVLKDLVLTTGNPTGQSRFMNTGISIKNWFGASVENVMVFYANSSGITIEDSADVHLTNVYVEGGTGLEYGGTFPLVGAGITVKGSRDCYLNNVYSDTNDQGFLLESSTNNNLRNIFLSQCEATLNQQKGLSISQAEGIVVSDSLFEGTYGDGIMITDSRQVTISDTILQGNLGNGIVITSHSLNMSLSQIMIETCTVKDNGQNAIGIWAKDNQSIGQVSIEDCNLVNSGTGVLGNPDQPMVWDGVDINTDPVTSGYCFNIKITDCNIGNMAGQKQTQEYGIRTLGNSDYVQIFSNNFFQNLGGNYNLVGSNNNIADNINGWRLLNLHNKARA